MAGAFRSKLPKNAWSTGARQRIGRTALPSTGKGIVRQLRTGEADVLARAPPLGNSAPSGRHSSTRSTGTGCLRERMPRGHPAGGFAPIRRAFKGRAVHRLSSAGKGGRTASRLPNGNASRRIDTPCPSWRLKATPILVKTSLPPSRSRIEKTSKSGLRPSDMIFVLLPVVGWLHDSFLRFRRLHGCGQKASFRMSQRPCRRPGRVFVMNREMHG